MRKSTWCTAADKLLRENLLIKGYVDIDRIMSMHPEKTRENIIDRRSFLVKQEKIKLGILKIKDYYNVPRKDYLQRLLFSQFSGFNCDILGLMGNTPDRYFELLKEYNIFGMNSIFFSYERKKKLARMLKEKYDSDNISVTHGDIIEGEAQRFMDIDLMCKWSTGINVIKKLFDRQKVSYKGKDKGFLFTICYAREANIMLTDKIKSYLTYLLNQNVDVSTPKLIHIDKQNDKIQVSQYVITAKNYDILAYYYNDTCAMLSFSIKYR
jgi:predicted nucleotidyltransferase